MSTVHVVVNVCLRLGDQPGHMLVPGNNRGEIVLQRAHLLEIPAQRTVGRTGGTTGPDTTVEHLDLLVPAGVHHVGKQVQDPVVLASPVVVDVLVGVGPPTRLEHPPGVLPRRPRNTHRLLSSPQHPGRSDQTCQVGTRSGSLDRRAHRTAVALACGPRQLVSGTGRHG